MNKKTTKPVVCVFCSSSVEVPEIVKSEGADFAKLLAENNFALLYGGTTCGLMKVIADAHKAANGHLIGIIPGYMIERGLQHPDLDESYAVEDLRPRKQEMLDKSDFIVALPGGIGTYDEIFDLLAMRQLKRHHKPMFLLNTDNYFEPLIKLLEQGVKYNTIKPEHLELLTVAQSPEELVKKISSYKTN